MAIGDGLLSRATLRSALATCLLLPAAPGPVPTPAAPVSGDQAAVESRPAQGTAKTGEDPWWPAFRGPDANPVGGRALPVRWSTTDNVEWSVEVPGLGWSSPIVVDGRVLVTSAVSPGEIKPPEKGTEYSNEYVAELIEQGVSQEEAVARVTERDIELPHETAVSVRLWCFELESGELLWDRELYEGAPPGGRHRKNSFASETPVTDGERVWVYLGNVGIWAYDLDGEPLWRTRLEPLPIYLDLGTGASPALHDGRLFVVNDNQQQQYVAAFDAASGEELWRAERELGPQPPQNRSAWATPFVWENDLRTELVTIGSGAAVAYDLDGAELWRMSGFSTLAAPSPFAYDGLLYLVSGVHGDSNRPIAAVRPGASGDITLPAGETSSEHVAWYDRVAGTYIPTPVAYDDALWVLYDRGIFARYDARTGERTFRARIPDSGGAFTSSPWAYGGKIFCLSEEGDTFVIEAAEEFRLLHVNPLGEMALATPAIAGDRLLVRTQSRLYSIREQPEPAVE